MIGPDIDYLFSEEGTKNRNEEFENSEAAGNLRTQEEFILQRINNNPYLVEKINKEVYGNKRGNSEIETITGNSEIGAVTENLVKTALERAEKQWMQGLLEDSITLLRAANFVHEAEQLIRTLVDSHGTKRKNAFSIWKTVFPNTNVVEANILGMNGEKWQTEVTRFLLKEAERKFSQGFVTNATSILKQINMDEMAHNLLKESDKLGKTATTKTLKQLWKGTYFFHNFQKG